MPLFFIAAFVGLYYHFIPSAYSIHFHASYLVILLPIWLIDGIRSAIESFTPAHYMNASEDLSKVTVVIPCKDGAPFISKTIADLKKRFPKNRIILASNGSTDRTCEIARSLGVVCLEYKEPLGKVRTINKALTHVKTPYVLLLDDDTLIGGAVIPTGLLDYGFEGVAFRVFVYESTWITRFQQYEYKKSCDIGKRYMNQSASVQNVSGAIGLFNTRHLITQIKRHSGEFSGEDLQRTLLVHLTNKAKGVVLTESVVYTQPPETLAQLFQQRTFGWFPGLYSNFKRYIKIMTRDDVTLTLRLDSIYNAFLVSVADILRLLSLPILMLNPWYFMIMYAAYLLLELPSYLRNASQTPVWVYLLYPLYGLFCFITRVTAWSVFVYRRMVVRLEKRHFLDDYRNPQFFSGLVASCATILAFVMFAIADFIYHMGVHHTLRLL